MSIICSEIQQEQKVLRDLTRELIALTYLKQQINSTVCEKKTICGDKKFSEALKVLLVGMFMS